MIICLFVLLLSFNNLISSEVLNKASNEKRQTIDRVLATVYTSEGISVICQADLRPSIDGVARDLKEVILDRLILSDGKKIKIVKDDKDQEQKAEDDRYLSGIQKRFNLSHDDIVKLFKDMGYSYEEGLNELRNMRLKDAVLGPRVRSKILVDKKDVAKFCLDNPVYHPTVYVISHAIIPYDSKLTKQEQLEQVDKNIKSGEIISTANWQTPFELKETDIAPEKAQIKELTVSSVMKLEDGEDGIKLLRLVDKKPAYPISVEERNKEVTHILSKERYEKALDKYQKNLLSKAHVKYTSAVSDADKLS